MKRPMLGWLRWLLPPFVLAGCLAFTTPSDAPQDVNPGTWRILAHIPSERQEVAVAAAGAKVYVIGGFGDGFAPSTLVEAYERRRTAGRAGRLCRSASTTRRPSSWAARST